MTIPEQAAQVHAEAPVLLAHVHMQRTYTPEGIEYDRPDEDVPGRQVDIPKLRQGGVKTIWLSEGGPGEIVVDAEALQHGYLEPNDRPAIRTLYHGPPEVQRMLRGWDATNRLCKAHAVDLQLVTTVRQAREITAAGRIAVFWTSECLLLANDLAMLHSYYGLGMRVCGLVHGSPLDWVDPDVEQRDPGGLTDFGRQVVREMNALGMVVDVSHASEQTVYDVLEESQQPIVASHSNAKHLSPIQRNLSDDVLERIAAGGGVIGVHCSSAFSDIQCLLGRENVYTPTVNQQRLEMIGRILTPGGVEPFQYEAQWRARGMTRDGATFPTVSLEKLVDVIDYMVGLVGVDHVGVGTDLQYLEDAVEGFQSAAETPNLTAALLARGYASQDVRMILGGNFLRVMEQVIGA
jgi:membrane dipeptidase